MADVFISYSHKDGDYAHRLADELRSRQIEVWIDDRIDYGDQWPRVIQENLAACRIFIVLMSSRAFNSMWVQNEVSYAQSNGKALFPLLLEGNVWLSMSATQYVDVRTGEMPPEKFFEKLKRQLNESITHPRQQWVPPSIPRQRRVNRWVLYIAAPLLLSVALSGFLVLNWFLGLSPTVTLLTEASPTELLITDAPTPIPIYYTGDITFITGNETGESLFILERDGSQRPLLEEQGIQSLKILSISPLPDVPSAPRYLAVSYRKDDAFNAVVLNIKDASRVTIAQGVEGVNATYLEDGRLLVEIKADNTATYKIYQVDGTNPQEIYTTVLSLPTSVPTSAP